MYESHKEMKGFPERIYVSTQEENSGYGLTFHSVAVEDVDQAVQVGQPVEVGIYQLVRTAKFQKTAVEIKSILKEIK